MMRHNEVRLHVNVLQIGSGWGLGTAENQLCSESYVSVAIQGHYKRLKIILRQTINHSWACNRLVATSWSPTSDCQHFSLISDRKNVRPERHFSITIVNPHFKAQEPQNVADHVDICGHSPEKDYKGISLRFGRRVAMIIEDVQKIVRTSKTQKIYSSEQLCSTFHDFFLI